MRTIKDKAAFIYCTTFILLVISCSQNKTEFTFWQGERQMGSQRAFSGSLAVADSILLYEQYDMPRAAGLMVEGNDLYIRDSGHHEIYIVDIQTLNHIGTISPPKGKGPGELTSFGSFDITDGNVAILGNSYKVQFWNTGGEFIREFLAEELQPRRIRFRSDGKLIVLSKYFFVTEENNLLHVINPESKIEFGFGKVSENNYSSLKAEGYILTDEEDNIYYSGYSEHILKKWDSEGNLIYSVASIDNHPSGFNYASTEGESQRIMGYSEFANYHSIGTAFLNDYWLILHGGIPAEPDYTPILDIYDRGDGQYLFSMELPYQTSEIVSGEDYLYALHTIEDDIYLVKYDIQQLEDHF